MRMFFRYLPGFVILGIVLSFCSGALIAQDEPADNVKLEIFLTEDGVRISPTREDSDRVFLHKYLVIRDGFYGNIYLGERSSRVKWFTRYLIDEGYLSGPAAANIKDISASLMVLPRIVGGTIEIDIMPLFYCDTGEGEAMIELKYHAETKTVKDGKELRLGPSTLQSEFYNNFFKTEDGKILMVTLIPSILEYGGVVE